LPKRPLDLVEEMTSEASILSFIVHIWKEDLSTERHQISWRGYITSVPNGKRKYFSDIKDIPALIAAQLKTPR
jgi:hypothetical protein